MKKVLYLTQCCAKKGAETLVPWKDTCAGHASLDEALTCNLAQKALHEGKAVDTRLVPEQVQRSVLLAEAIHTAHGHTTIQRMIKRTIEEEIIDA